MPRKEPENETKKVRVFKSMAECKRLSRHHIGR